MTIFTLGLDAEDFYYTENELTDLLSQIERAENGVQVFVRLSSPPKKEKPIKGYKTDKGVLCFLVGNHKFRIPIKRWSELKEAAIKASNGQDSSFYHGTRAMSSSLKKIGSMEDQM